MKSNATQDFLETILRLDAHNDVTEFLEFVQGTRHGTQEMLVAISQLLSKGRIRSAYILAMLLIKRGQRDLLMSVTLAIGGVLYGNPTEEDNGLKYLSDQVDALSQEEKTEFYDRILTPVLPDVWAGVPAKSDHESIMKILKSFKEVVPEGFEWKEGRCWVCCAPADYVFHADLLKQHRVAYYRCKKCEFLSVEPPHWLEEVYADPLTMGANDPNSVSRSLEFKAFVSLLLRNLFDSEAKFLDYGGGYGLFVRLMRDAWFDFYWQDPYCHNLFAQGFEAQEETTYELVTAFECFQHFVDPMAELDHLFDKTDCLLFTTQLVPDPMPLPDAWPYYALDSGQHVAFYSRRSLKRMAETLGLVFLSNGRDTHMFTKRHLSNKLFDGLSHWRS